MAIVQAGDPVLRRLASPVAADRIGSDGMNQLIDALYRALAEVPGVGVAAPQLGVGLRVVLIQDPAEFQARVDPDRLIELEREPIQPYVLINPFLEVVGLDTRTFFEGCLSVEGYRGLVRRAATVRVRYLDVEGRQHDEIRHGWHARILQHEVDHLDGALYVDRMLTRSFMTDAHYVDWALQPTGAVFHTFGIG
ncbi:MAG: peptide deformylase [Actinomycetota bacterium]|nr:peptide deformylase [Actinomycetota bacterium]